MKSIYNKLLAALALGVAVYAADGQAEDVKPPAQSIDIAASRQEPPAERAGHIALGNEINGRTDWDVDYPSQLAPQSLHSPDAANASMIEASFARPTATHGPDDR